MKYQLLYICIYSPLLLWPYIFGPICTCHAMSPSNIWRVREVHSRLWCILHLQFWIVNYEMTIFVVHNCCLHETIFKWIQRPKNKMELKEAQHGHWPTVYICSKIPLRQKDFGLKSKVSGLYVVTILNWMAHIWVAYGRLVVIKGTPIRTHVTISSDDVHKRYSLKGEPYKKAFYTCMGRKKENLHDELFQLLLWSLLWF